MGQSYFVYMVANRRHGALYTGVTNDIVRRTYEHREGLVAQVAVVALVEDQGHTPASAARSWSA